MEQDEIRRRAVLVEQSAFRACMECAGSVGHDADGMICARDPQVTECGLLRVNELRYAAGTEETASLAETMINEMTEDWAMSHVGGEKIIVPKVVATVVAAPAAPPAPSVAVVPPPSPAPSVIAPIADAPKVPDVPAQVLAAIVPSV